LADRIELPNERSGCGVQRVEAVAPNPARERIGQTQRRKTEVDSAAGAIAAPSVRTKQAASDTLIIENDTISLSSGDWDSAERAEYFDASRPGEHGGARQADEKSGFDHAGNSGQRTIERIRVGRPHPRHREHDFDVTL